jgi:hypothetical protein
MYHRLEGFKLDIYFARESVVWELIRLSVHG